MPPKSKARSTKATKEAQEPSTVERTKGLKYLVGAHVAAAGGIENSVQNAINLG